MDVFDFAFGFSGVDDGIVGSLYYTGMEPWIALASHRKITGQGIWQIYRL